MQDALPQVRHTATAEAGDQLREWIRTQYEEYGPGLRRYLVRLTGDAAEAEDIAQEVFLKAYERFDQLHQDPRAGGWLAPVPSAPSGETH